MGAVIGGAVGAMAASFIALSGLVVVGPMGATLAGLGVGFASGDLIGRIVGGFTEAEARTAGR